MKLMIGREGNTEKKSLRKLMIKVLIKYRNKRNGNDIFRSVFFIKKKHTQLLKNLAKGLERSMDSLLWDESQMNRIKQKRALPNLKK